MTHAERRAALEQIADEIRGCTRCRLHRDRTNAVPGEGSASTEVVFIGEGPGLNEDRQGRPFVGQAGTLLTELIGSIGWRREDVFITNIVKCRPPGNRDPEPDEIAACAPYLERQLAVLEPALVVTLGRHSMGRFMPGVRIGQAHGTVRPADPGIGPAGAHVFAMYHPAAALHQQSLRQTLVADMRGVPAALVDARAARAAQETPSPPVPPEPTGAAPAAGPSMGVMADRPPAEPSPARTPADDTAVADVAAAETPHAPAGVLAVTPQPETSPRPDMPSRPGTAPQPEASVVLDEPLQPEAPGDLQELEDIPAPSPAGEAETDQLSLF